MAEQAIKSDVKTTDEQLMKEVQKGSTNAFDELVLRYHQDAIRLAYFYLSNWEDARDLSQDVFIKVYQQAQIFDTKKSFRPWFFRILVNHVFNFIKRRNRVRFSPFLNQDRLDDNSDYLEQNSNSEGDETELSTMETVRYAIEQLKDKHKNVIILHEIQGMTGEEVASILKCSKGTVKSRLHYARKKLKTILEKEI